MATLSAIAVPQSLAAVDRARAMSAARFLASRMAVARSQAVMRSTHVALRFEDGTSGITFRMFVDGNRNGVRTADISAGIDVPVEAPVRLGELYQGVAIAVAGAAGSDPVKLGASNLLSFTPFGTATSGSVFVRGRDGSQFAVRVLGATGRARVLRLYRIRAIGPTACRVSSSPAPRQRPLAARRPMFRAIPVAILSCLALSLTGCSESSLEGCVETLAGGPLPIATARDQRFQGKVRESTARCRGGEVALKFLDAPWVDWANYYATRDATSLEDLETRNRRGIGGALIDLEYTRVELLKFNLFDNAGTYQQYVTGRPGIDGPDAENLGRDAPASDSSELRGRRRRRGTTLYRGADSRSNAHRDLQ